MAGKLTWRFHSLARKFDILNLDEKPVLNVTLNIVDGAVVVAWEVLDWGAIQNVTTSVCGDKVHRHLEVVGAESTLWFTADFKSEGSTIVAHFCCSSDSFRLNLPRKPA